MPVYCFTYRGSKQVKTNNINSVNQVKKESWSIHLESNKNNLFKQISNLGNTEFKNKEM